MSVSSSQIQIRDPFVVPVASEGIYYLYGTTDKDCWKGPGTGFDCYTSTDLQTWAGPIAAFRPPPDFWAYGNFWAPELHIYQGRYYLLASFKAPNVPRGTQILIADALTGPFRPHTQRPVTPPDWECLDGTLYVDPDSTPYMVFCHEWLQVHDGTMCAIQLSPDLKQSVGEPMTLFSASSAAWPTGFKDTEYGVSGDQLNYVTDGPYLYRTQAGSLLMLWSSHGTKGYAIGVSRSANGKIDGEWIHEAEPIFAGDGGHGMLFHRFDGQLMLSIHTPNDTPNERPIFIEMVEVDDTLRIGY